jgi:hypothetical protein
MRSSAGTNVAAPGVVTSVTNWMIACLADPSCQDGSGCACVLTAAISHAAHTSESGAIVGLYCTGRSPLTRCPPLPSSGAPGKEQGYEALLLGLPGVTHRRLWRQEGNILDILVQRCRDKKAAKTFFRKLLKGLTCVPRVIVTDQLKSYGAAMRELLPGGEHRQHRDLNNGAEHSHQPTRQRERRMQGFTSPGDAPRVLAADGPITSHFSGRGAGGAAPQCTDRR